MPKKIKSKLYIDHYGNKFWKLPNDKDLHREGGPAVERINGDKEWWVNGKLHRKDGPAIEYVSGNKYWYINGKPHREDGPAVENVNGDKHWYINGKRHREDGPAIKYANGDEEWYVNDQHHRTDGPAVNFNDLKCFYFKGMYCENLFEVKKYNKFLKNNNYKCSMRKYFYKYDCKSKILHKYWYVSDMHEYFLKDKYHRVDGPALITKENGIVTKEWYLNGQRHRIDGPAVIQRKYKAYYLFGKFYNKKDYFKFVKSTNSH